MLIEGIGWFCDKHGGLNCPVCPDPYAEALRPVKSLTEVGRDLWTELHTSVTLETLAEWENRIPSFSCGCRKFYKEWKAYNQPRKDNFFAWTVELHNAVNEKLGKPKITLDEARRIWMV
jgi:hypothetical protein